MPVQAKPELAAKGALFKEIPAVRATISVTASSQTGSLSTYQGKWIWLRAITADVTILRGTHTLVANAGYIIPAGTTHGDFYVDPDGDLSLSYISSGTATLEVLY